MDIFFFFTSEHRFEAPNLLYQGNISRKDATIKDSNSMDLTEAEDIRRGGKNTQKNCTKKIIMTQITEMV